MDSFSFVTSFPNIIAVPEVGAINPSNVRIVVDFPAPFGPMKLQKDPGKASLPFLGSFSFAVPLKMLKITLSLYPKSFPLQPLLPSLPAPGW